MNVSEQSDADRCFWQFMYVSVCFDIKSMIVYNLNKKVSLRKRKKKSQLYTEGCSLKAEK